MNAASLRRHKDAQDLLQYALVGQDGCLPSPRPGALDPHRNVVFVNNFFGQPLLLLGGKLLDPRHGLGVFHRPAAGGAGQARAQPPVEAGPVVHVPTRDGLPRPLFWHMAHSNP